VRQRGTMTRGNWSETVRRYIGRVADGQGLAQQQQDALHQYVVVLKGPAAVRFEHDEFMGQQFNGVPMGNEQVTIFLMARTRYSDEGFSVPIPRDLWIEVRGPAPSLDQAIEAFANLALGSAATLSVSANGAVGDLKVELAYDDTPDLNEHEYFQMFIRGERGMMRPSSRVDIPATLALAQAVNAHPNGEAINRAIGQYHAALATWEPGKETLVLSHLYKGMEALMDLAKRTERRKHGLAENDRKGLAAILGVDKREVDETIIQSVLFAGDAECYQTARDARNDYEHGLANFDVIRARARHVVDRTAGYLRAAIIDLAGVGEPTRATLLSERFDTTMGLWGLVRIVRGHFIGTVDRLAAPDQEYPYLDWQSSMKSVARSQTGGYEIVPDEKITPRGHPDIQFRLASLGVWGPRKGAKVEPDTVQVEVQRSLQEVRELNDA